MAAAGVGCPGIAFVMAYKPSRNPALNQEPFAATERLHANSRRKLEGASIVGLTVEEARRRVEALGLTFRPVESGGVESADWSAARVTATVLDGVVRQAAVR